MEIRTSLSAEGECAQRIDDLPSVKDFVEIAVKEASGVIRSLPRELNA